MALAISCFIAACLSLKFSGGLLVFAGRIKTFLEFSLIVVPVLAFPVALLAWLSSRLAASLWIVIILLFYGAQAVVAWPHVWVMAHTGTLFSLPFFLTAGVLLCWTAILDRRASE